MCVSSDTYKILLRYSLELAPEHGPQCSRVEFCRLRRAFTGSSSYFRFDPGHDFFQLSLELSSDSLHLRFHIVLIAGYYIVAYLRRLLLSNGSVNTSQQRNCFL
jgi:hypothetical protein